MESSNLVTTPLVQLHQSLGAKMVPFANYLMPLQYEGIVAEHLHTRSQCSLFDVSHMGQSWIRGNDFTSTAESLQRVVPANLMDLPEGKMCYSTLLNEAGGIVDDLIITRLPNDNLYSQNEQKAFFHVVVNASRKIEDYAYFNRIFAEFEGNIRLSPIENFALIALQGPATMEVLERLNPVVTDMPFMTAQTLTLAGISCWISRSGYTGEIGFEIATETENIVRLCEQLLSDDHVKMAGLGARDSLRLEAGLPLYGNDMDEQTSPVEANLNFVLNKKRLSAGDFAGAEVIINQLSKGVEFLRVGLDIDGRAPIRQGTVLMCEGEEVGVVTSGCFSPTLQKPIAFAKLKTTVLDKDNIVAVVRKNHVPVTVGKLVFVPANYK